MKDKGTWKCTGKDLHYANEDQKNTEAQKEKTFIMSMKDKRTRKRRRRDLHDADEGQKNKETQKKSPSSYQ
ncbi:hypothetical protein CFK40_20195 [Virgibacillus necropolis]|uniref:Uncharacterized protein n=1 Tax=Virgibacillus necropolis TaxID=163877 RepID=A0A221MHM4_9BACI|nr:hypothetical protein CFK40_20195 [Virgibacillus necropolis]